MFSVETYLSAIGYDGPTEPNAQTLRELHRRHLMLIPFNNSAQADLGTAVLNDVDVNLDETFEKVVVRRQGGVCFELSGMFQRLLRELGYDVIMLSSGVRGPSGAFGPDLEHMFLGVRLDGEVWLTDVGFAGPGYVDPLLLSPEVQEQYGCQYRVLPQGEYHVVDRKTQAGDWQAVYRFRLQPRTLAEWEGAGGSGDEDDPGWNWEGEIVAAGTVIRARSFEEGQMVLVGRRYLRVDGGHEKVRVLVDPVDFQAVVDDILGVAG
ncbi:arylamine N-acetyltransferase [Micromonospora sp. NPDC050397]|uniref:arylamine N-acetyltransferase family protein n=1 Tax=Micromonospora sp. NPDC050397 TaxID=3364279 RepID=UPI00384AFC05